MAYGFLSWVSSLPTYPANFGLVPPQLYEPIPQNKSLSLTYVVHISPVGSAHVLTEHTLKAVRQQGVGVGQTPKLPGVFIAKAERSLRNNLDPAF